MRRHWSSRMKEGSNVSCRSPWSRESWRLIHKVCIRRRQGKSRTEAVLGIHETHLTYNKGAWQVCDTPPSNGISACHGCLRYSLSETFFISGQGELQPVLGEEVINSMGLMDVQRKKVQTLVVVVADEPMKMDHCGKSFWTLVNLCWVASQQVCA